MTLREWFARLSVAALRSRQHRRAAERVPGLARTWHDLGNDLCARGELAEAVASFRRALAMDPDHAASHRGLGRALRLRGALDEAIESLRLALSLAPDDPGTAHEMSLVLLQRGEEDLAETYARRAVHLVPHSAPAHLHLAEILRRRGRLDEALDSCRDAVRRDPGLAQAHNNLGNAHKDLGNAAQAIASYRKALELDPALAEAHFNLGIAVHENGEVAQACVHYRAALALRPELADAHLNLGYAHEQLGDPAGAIRSYRAAIAIQPGLAEAHFNLALQLLLTEAFAQGWEEYEWRWRLPEAAGSRRDAPGRLWNGEDLAGKVLLLYAEQGFGDAIQFARYAPLVARMGARVALQCAPGLKALFASLPGVWAVLGDDDPLPEFDLCHALLGLPRLLGTTLECIPASVPYLHADPAKARHWKDKLGRAGTAPRVGLVWASQPASRLGRAKSLGLAQLAPLGAVANVSFHSLQLGPAADQAAHPPSGMTIVDWSAELGDFSDTAALIANLDLVISVDTAVAHLAGAMAKPVWTLAHFPPDWRWLLERADSPWYPTMRLFRQRQLNDWTGVIDELAQALREFRPTCPTC